MFKTVAVQHLRLLPWMKVIGGSLLIAIFSRAAIPLPFTPIPIAVQAQVCLLLGVLLGSRLGALAVVAYVIQGVMGLPVFALGHAGLGVLLGPRGGYLIGYVLGAWVAGYLAERSQGKAGRALIAGNLAIYLCGLPQLSLFVGAEKAFSLGMLPFLIGDAVKLILSYQVLLFCRSKIDR